MGILIAGIPLETISGAGDFSELIRFNLSDAAFITKLKGAQLITSLMIFIVPSFLFVRLTAPATTTQVTSSENKTVIGYLKLDQGFPGILIIVIPLLMLSALPLINLMAEINAKMVFPEFLNNLETWMKKAEEDAKIMTEAFLKMDSAGSLIFNLVMIALIPAFGEELLFRGVIQQLCTRWTNNIHRGIWIAAILFSALHGQFYGFIPRMVLGALLGYLFFWSGSLWLPFLAHFVNNGSAVLVSFLVQKKIIPEDVENIGSGQDELYYVLSSAFIVVILLWMVWKRREYEPQ